MRGANSKPLAVSCLIALVVCLAFLLHQRTQSPRQGSGSPTGARNPASRKPVRGSKDGDVQGRAIHPNTHGLLLVSKDITGPHPIEGLLADAEAKAKAIEKKNKDILYLRDAVKDYETAFGMKPPRGFEKW
jgi:beta-1,2-xylosyltransferase